jgi:radical SAM protein with 4Fe4S-binding SPASM domain
MQEKISSGRVEKREFLHAVVPLKAPFTVAISPSELCNFRCVYCNWGTPVGIPNATKLKWDDFVTIAEQVKELYNRVNLKCKNVRFNGNGEPLLNPKMAEMVKYINDLNFSERIEITTNASLLTHDLSEALISGGLTRLIVSVQGVTSEKYHKICGYKIDYDKFLLELKYFHDFAQSLGGKCKLHIKTIDIAVPDEREIFYQIFDPICDTMNIDNVMASCADVDYESFPEFEKERTRYNKPFVERKCCDTLFYLMNILPNGNVNCCGCKWPPHVVGNIFKKNLHEIWNSGQHKEEMIVHLKGLRETLQDCKNCASITQYTMPEDNLDQHLNDILQRMQ